MLALDPGSTVMVADLLTPYVPVMVTGVFAVTADVVMVKLREVCPAGTVTVGGTWAADALLVESVTAAPPDGAGPLNVTVAGMLVPPVALAAPGVIGHVAADQDLGAFMQIRSAKRFRMRLVIGVGCGALCVPGKGFPSNSSHFRLSAAARSFLPIFS